MAMATARSYTYYGTSPIGGATLWTYADTSAQKLYVALVVDGRFNDNAFDMKLHPGDPSAYMQSAGWTTNGANARPAFHLMNSEYAEFTATICGTDYTWRQGYAAEGDKTNAEDYDNMAQDWHSDMDESHQFRHAPHWLQLIKFHRVEHEQLRSPEQPGESRLRSHVRHERELHFRWHL